MQFSLTTVIAVLATTHAASAWKITAYNVGNCNNNFFSNSREITGSQPTPCYTFGRSMPGTSCTERRGNGATGACIGNLTPKSIKAEGNCVFFVEPDCGESSTGQLGITFGDSATCVQSDLDNVNVMSYICY